MAHAIATVAALAGIVLTAGSDPWLAFGIGLLVFGAVLVLNELTERLQRIEHAVGEVAAHLDAVALQHRLGPEPPAPGAPSVSSPASRTDSQA
jgi:hypothetical protein